jgi:hypothetical protein
VITPLVDREPDAIGVEIPLTIGWLSTLEGTLVGERIGGHEARVRGAAPLVTLRPIASSS